MIKTSVIIPVYNTVEYLKECVESVLAQTQKEIEIILVDDGSDDGSWEMEQDYARRYPFIRAVRQEHLYQGTARNRGLEMAQGEYIYFMDSDDALLPGLFETAYAVCEEKQLDFVMFDAKGFRYDENDVELEVPEDIADRRGMGIEDRLYTGPEFWNAFYARHGVLYVCWLLYIRKSFLLENRLYYEERTYFEDNDWMLRMYMNAGRTYYLPRIFHRHRWRRGSNMLDGFTPGLLEGCFRMYDVLKGLLRKETDYEKRLMIGDVTLLNVRRFSRLREVPPAEEYTVPLRRFCRHLREDLEKENMDDYSRAVQLAIAIRILAAAKEWEDSSFYEEFRYLAAGVDLFGLPEFSEKTRLAIYGTGVIADCLMRVIRICRPDLPEEILFVDTSRDSGEFYGYPVRNVRELEAFRPDLVIIASTKYRDEMEAEARKRLPESVPVAFAPRELMYLVR